jgi:hypothetical protein
MNEQDEYIVKGLGDISDELIVVSDVIKEKKYFDEELSGTIKQSLSSLIETINNSEKEKKYFDPELAGVIKNSLSETLVAISKMERPKIDMTPVIKIASGIAEQNKTIIETIEKLTKPETNDKKYQELLKLSMELIAKNNEFLKNGLLSLTKPDKKISTWEFVVERENYTQLIKKITAKER